MAVLIKVSPYEELASLIRPPLAPSPDHSHLLMLHAEKLRKWEWPEDEARPAYHSHHNLLKFSTRYSGERILMALSRLSGKITPAFFVCVR